MFNLLLHCLFSILVMATNKQNIPLFQGLYLASLDYSGVFCPVLFEISRLWYIFGTMTIERFFGYHFLGP